jgi:hypothetical protein
MAQKSMAGYADKRPDVRFDGSGSDLMKRNAEALRLMRAQVDVSGKEFLSLLALTGHAARGGQRRIGVTFSNGQLERLRAMAHETKPTRAMATYDMLATKNSLAGMQSVEEDYMHGMNDAEIEQELVDIIPPDYYLNEDQFVNYLFEDPEDRVDQYRTDLDQMMDDLRRDDGNFADEYWARELMEESPDVHVIMTRLGNTLQRITNLRNGRIEREAHRRILRGTREE